MLSVRFWVSCMAGGALMAACGSSDQAKSARGDGGEGGTPLGDAGEASVPVAGKSPVTAGGMPGGGAPPVAEAGAGGVLASVAGAGGSPPEPLALTVTAKYPTNGSFWLDYVKDDGDERTSATDTACDAATDGPRYDACVHGGEVRKVALPTLASCAGVAATDSLGAFDWICQAADVGVEVVSTGLKNGKHMSSLLDFAGNGWLNNSVTVTLDGEAFANSDPAAWWQNPVAHLAGASCTADVGAEHTIFLLDAASSSANCTGKAGKIGLATVPGATVTDFRFTGRGGFNWYEGAYTLQAQFSGLSARTNGFQVARNISFTALSAGTGNAGALDLSQTRASVIRDVTSTAGRGIIGASSASGLQVSDVTLTSAGLDAIYLNSCADCSVERATINGTGGRAINLTQGVNPRARIRDVTASKNAGGGIELSQCDDARVENVKITGAGTPNLNGGGGLVAVNSDRVVFKSITVDGAVGVGVSVDQGDDGRLVDIHVGNAGANGVFLGGSRAVLQHARISCGKGTSITTGTGVLVANNNPFGRIQDVITMSCRYGMQYNGNANILQGVTVAATEDVGFYTGSYAALIEDALALDTTYGLYFLSQVFVPPQIRNFASTNNNDGSVYVNNSTVDFGEQLIVGTNGPTGMGSDCTVGTGSGLIDKTCAGSGASLTTGVSVLGSIVGLVTDATNPQGATGAANYDTITSFTTFTSDTRRFIRAGAGFPDLTARGPCTGTASCSILDLALKSTDTLLRNRNALPTGNDVRTHEWFIANNAPADQAACDARVPGSVFVVAAPNRCDSVFLKHAWELLEDGIGDNDGLCESNETCEVARNIGGYQGHGPLVSAGAFTPGTLTGITLVQRQSNGY